MYNEHINHRILVVDDSPAIHSDFVKILTHQSDDETDWIESEIFGGSDSDSPAESTNRPFLVDSAFQGQEGLERVRQAHENGHPYALAFVDIRMPPGWNGVETIEKMWEVDPRLQVVLCSAYSDYPWEEIGRRFHSRDGLIILKKPFDIEEVLQISHTLTKKWTLHESEQRQLDALEVLVAQRTHELNEINASLKREIEQRLRAESELRLAQKLESIGQLAAGISHEINTPVQYVGDNVHFIRSAFEELEAVRIALRNACEVLSECTDRNDVMDGILTIEDELDIEELTSSIPESFEATLEGLERIAKIVQAMKEFGHQDSGVKSQVDINRALLNTLEVARSEYRYVADVSMAFGDIPLVECLHSEMNQVFLNLIVNAAHAIEDVVRDTGERGKMTITTSTVDGHVLITIADTGSGIPEEIRPRIFDPFFTTKEVGKGTGQGLAIARSVVVDKHQGTLTFETEVEKGTTFLIQLPITN